MVSDRDRLRLVGGSRKNNLPVAWDGEPLRWQAPFPLSDLGPEVGPHYCDGHRAATTNVAVFLAYVERAAPVSRPPSKSGLRGKNQPRARTVLTRKLLLRRCLDCGHDLAYDVELDRLWDLVPSDYSDGGSWGPADVESGEPQEPTPPPPPSPPAPAPA